MLSINNYKKVIKEIAPTGISILGLGRPGCGKSNAVEQVREELNLEGYIDVRLGLRDPSEVKGVIGINPEKELSFQTLPDYFPRNQKTGILHLDELPQAAPMTQAAAYQLILDRKIGKFELPKGWLLISSGNRKIDGGINFKMPPALINRFMILNVEATLAEWLNYAAEKEVNPAITAFHSFNRGSYLYYQDANENSSGSINSLATPRSWFAVDKVLNSEVIISDEFLLRETLTGTIGREPTNQFINYFNVVVNSIDIEDVFNGNFTHSVVNEIPKEALYSTLSALETYAKTSNIKELAYNENLINFMDMLDNLSMKAMFFNNLNAHKNTKKLITSKSKSNVYDKVRNSVATVIAATNN